MSTGIDKLAKELKEMISASDNRKPSPYDTQAEVLRVDGDTAWVHIPGGAPETPVSLTMNAKKGDLVTIHIADGSAWIIGNNTSPPTDDTEANKAKDAAIKAATTATSYIVDQDEKRGLIIRPSNSSGNDYLQMNSDAIDFYRNNISVMHLEDSIGRFGTKNNCTKVGPSGMEVLQNGDSVAQLGSIVRLGTIGSSHIDMDSLGITAISSDGVEYFKVANTGGYESIVSKTSISSDDLQISEKTYNLSTLIPTEWSSLTNGDSFGIVTSYYCEQYGNPSSSQHFIRLYANESESFVKGTASTSGTYILYDGEDTITITSSYPSLPITTTWPQADYLGHKGDSFTTSKSSVTPFYRFGRDTAESGGAFGFEQGNGTNAGGKYSVALNEGTRTNAQSQTAIGKYNTLDNNALFMVGMGTDDSNRRSAFSVGRFGEISIYDVANTFSETEHVILNNTSIAAGGVSDSTLNISKDGYYPIAISGWNSNTRYICTVQCRLSAKTRGAGTIDYMLYNPSSSARTGTVRVYVTWVKITS